MTFRIFITLIITTILTENFTLCKFLGICPFLGVSKKLNTAVGMSAAVIFVMALATAATYPINKYLLVANGLDYLQTIVFILVIAALVQLVEIAMKKFMPPLYNALGIYLPLITTNCAVLGVVLLNVQNDYTFIASVVYGITGGLGFLLAIVLIYLILAAQFESFKDPLVIMLTVPLAIAGALVFMWGAGQTMNIFSQIGIIMLIGLVAKNGILIVEFAKEEVEKGRDVIEAAIVAAHLRFRPIVMTSLAFILGLLPLVFASGPGSASRQGIGTGVFFGMLVAISVGIVFVPFFFVWIYRIKEKMKR